MKNRAKKNKSMSKSINTIIEFSSHGIKLVQSTFKKKKIITFLECRDNIGDSQRASIDTLASIIKTNHLKIDSLTISLDRSLVSMRFIKLPSANEEEIKEMVRWQAAKLFPYNIEEIIVSHQTIKSSKDGFSHVLLSVIPNDIAKKYINICEALKLQPQAIAISSEGLAQWYVQRQAHVSSNEAIALIDIEKTKFELVVVYQDKFIFSRTLSLTQMNSEDQVRNKVIHEIKLSLESYRKQEIFQPIKRVVLVGDRDHISRWVSPFANEFNLTPSIINHTEDIEVEKNIAKSWVGRSISFASVFGFILSEGLPQINLLPPKIRKKNAYLEKKNQLFKTVSLAFFAILVFLGLVSLNLYNKKKIIEGLDIQLNKINPTARELQDIKNKMAIVNAQLNDENSCIEVWREIHKITPQNLYLSAFMFEEEKEVVLKGMAPNMSLVFNFIPILNKSSFFQNAQVRYATQRKTHAGELTDFEIVCPLNSRAREK